MSEGKKDDTTRASARARGPDLEVWATFCKRVSEGRTERIAAQGLGVPYTTIRSWMDHHPEMREELKDARAVEVQRRLDRMETTPLSIGAEGGLHPKAAELMMKHDQWRLEGLDPEQFIPTKKVEQRTTIIEPPKDDTPIDVVRDALGLLSDEERAALAAELGGRNEG